MRNFLCPSRYKHRLTLMKFQDVSILLKRVDSLINELLRITQYCININRFIQTLKRKVNEQF